MHRLTDAIYREGSSENNRYSEKVTSYDRNGNIMGLKRYGRTGASAWGLIDDLTMTRTGNLLTSVADAGAAAYGGDFHAAAGTSSYDSNGALVSDTGRGITSITWNETGLPRTVIFSDGSSVAYSYAADGTKLRETRTVSGTSTVIDWCGDLVLEKTGSGARSAMRLLLDGAYVDLASGNSARRHFVRDHLGSVRAVVDDAGTVLETDDYYPLGGPLPTGTSTSLQPQKFQGKDWNPSASFNVYDFGARLYDPALGRWLSQDPIAEKYQTHSPYLFCAGNPMKFVDPDGMDWYQNNEIKLYQFFEGNDEIDGFTNIGETISVFLKDEGIYENYFQNIIVSRTEEALNAKSQILSNTSLLGQYISTSSGLSDYSKNSLLSSAIHQGQQDFLNNPVTKMAIGVLSGMIGEGIFVSTFTETSLDWMESIYRVYGGDSSLFGRYWTPTDPLSVPNYRAAAGLPDGLESGARNAGSLLAKGRVHVYDIIKKGLAAPLDGNPGSGIIEYQINPKTIKILWTKKLNPPL